VSAEKDAATGAETELLIREIDIAGSALSRHLAAAWTTATLPQTTHQ